MNESDTLAEFYICGLGILVCGVFGLIGNISTILLLMFRNTNMNQTFSNLIAWLAAIDSLFLVFICLSFSLPALSSSYKDETFPLLLPSLLPLSSVTLSGSVYCVIALATERYLHLTRPQDSNKGSFFGYILPVLVFSLLYNAPKFFEFTTDYRINKKSEMEPYVRATEFRKNVDYSLYVLGSNFIFMGILPFSILICLTCLVSYRLRHYFRSQERPDHSLFLLLFSIVVVQLVCHTPRTGLNIYEIYQALTGGDMSLTHPWLVDISHLMLAISSASNVIIFTVQDLRFRELLLRDLKKMMFLYRQGDSRERQEIEEGDSLVVSSVDYIEK